MKKLYVVAVLIAFTIGCGKTTNRVNIELNLKKGETYKQAMSNKMIVIQEFNGQRSESETNVSITMSYKVLSDERNMYDLETKINKVEMNMNMGPEGTLSFSSENEVAEDPFSIMLTAMKNKAFDFIIDKKGKVTDVKNTNELWSRVVESLGDIPKEQKDELVSNMENAFGKEKLKGNLEAFTAVLPDKSVEVGDTWTATTTLSNGMSATIDSKYELVELTGKYAVIEGNATITSDCKEVIKTLEKQTRFDMQGTMSSKVKIDLKTGWIMEGRVKQNINGDVYVRMQDNVEEIPIPMIMVNEIYVTP